MNYDEEHLQLVETVLGHVSMTPQEKAREQHRAALLTTLQELRIRSDSNLPPLEFLFQMMGKPCFPRGEVVSVTGKAKSGKTFFLSLLMAACTSEKDVIGIRRPPHAPPLRCLWYDTEQSRQSTLEILSQRILPLTITTPSPPSADAAEKPPEVQPSFQEELYDVFNTRGKNWEQRLELFGAALEHCRPDLVVVDGICDLVGDINDGTSVKPVIENLMAAAQAYGCCIVCAIHQNKGAEDRNPRGWIGTELNNKSFEVYACELLKPELIFAVEQTLSRRYRMDGLFYFTVDDDGKPHPSGAPETAAVERPATEKRRYPPMNEKYVQWNDNQMSIDIRSLFYDVLKSGALYFSDLQKRSMELLGCKDIGYWNKLFNMAKNQGVIINTLNQQRKSVWSLPARNALAIAPVLGPEFSATSEGAPF